MKITSRGASLTKRGGRTKIKLKKRKKHKRYGERHQKEIKEGVGVHAFVLVDGDEKRKTSVIAKLAKTIYRLISRPVPRPAKSPPPLSSFSLPPPSPPTRGFSCGRFPDKIAVVKIL